jgi:hypothetical protein
MSFIASGIALAGAVGGAVMDKQAQSAAISNNNKQNKYLNDAGKDVLSRGAKLADRKWQGFDSRQRVAGLSGNEKIGISGAAGLTGKYQPLIDRASRGFSSGALNEYMNPYTSGVLDVGARRINQDYDARLGALSRKRGMMDAFGSSRGTQMELGLQQQRSQALRDMETTGLNSAYDKGTEAFFRDRQGALDAAGTGMNLDRAAIDSQMGTGGVERGQQQAGKDFDYAQFLEKRDYDVTNFDTLLKSLHEAKGTQGAVTPASSMGSQIAGLASVAAGAYSQWKGSQQPSTYKPYDGSGGGISAASALDQSLRP